MISVSFSTVGQEPAAAFEVVWNGAIDRDWVRGYQQPPPPPKPPRRPAVDSIGLFFSYLEDHRLDLHDSASIAEALGVPQGLAANWLARAAERGLVRFVQMAHRGGRPARVYRVVG